MPLFALGALGTSPGKGQGVGESISTVEAENETLNRAQEKQVERRLRLKVDIRLCTIAGIICSFNLLDSGIISSGSIQFSLLPLEPGVNLPIILSANHPGMGFDANKSILLSAPPYYYAVIPVLLTSLLGDKLRLRGPLIFFNSLSFIAGFLILGFPTSKQVTVRSIGTFLSTGAYVSNWAALNAYLANNIVGQWKPATVAASVTASKGLGGIADSFIVRSSEALTYETAVLGSIV
ncbi:hypothetical protein ACO22_00290 [Paracoccidioides brasiliensis]|uniref:Major facilitator superfamily (MFS) profile domain-containing protein n=1 Tax=Paracoccidioides brasiliensis TaxID=121759 RepID=A0A1D2JPQ7_PARBR|nr:hypothetical protein ACO22_00290 [Paracoccidioides brasiliensis]